MILKRLFTSVFLVLVTLSSAMASETANNNPKPIHAPYLNVGQKEYMLVFYGYVGCTHICMPILDTIKALYTSNNFIPYQHKVDIIFVNLLPKIDKNQPDLFAKSYHPDFYGVYLSEKELSTLDKELQLFFTKSKEKSYDIDHSDHLYLIHPEPNGTLKLINIHTTHPLNIQQIIDDLNTPLLDPNQSLH